ncbi:hypothetical protein [Kribbella sp. CA-293567]|uniref:hypothetical protein n=1 Tax=Kribbella sp. CA-293567 TaxID=3002436 RepID=UPI0022DD56DB|nr:hypothetical protein [Kribbella sp. CA-293567]WBQ05404.1 hypothetical protein OX958_01070 [Kribbella sp. CA-293567]
MNTRTLATTVVAIAALITPLAVTQTASAATLKTVCADDLYVRDTASGQLIGTLYRGQHFNLSRYSASGQWAEGAAWGNVNKWGWVQSGWFC